MLLIQNIYIYVVDERVKDWYLMGSIETILAMQLLYLLFVLKLGPKWMETRKAFNLDKLLIVYNLTQMLINGYIFTIVIRPRMLLS